MHRAVAHFEVLPYVMANRAAVAVVLQGLSLAELSGFLAAHPGVNSTYRYSTDIGLEQFRDLMVSALAQPNTFVIVNFNRHALLVESRGG